MRIKARAKAGTWTKETSGLPRSIKGNNTPRVEGDNLLYLSDILPFPPMADGLNRLLADGEELTIVEPTPGVINFYCPKFLDSVNIEIENIVVDITAEIGTDPYGTTIVKNAEPVFGTIIVSAIDGSYIPIAPVKNGENPTTNQPGLNADAGVFKYAPSAIDIFLDAKNRRCNFFWSQSAPVKYSVLTDSFFWYAKPDHTFATINKFYNRGLIQTQNTPSIEFFEPDQS